MATPESHDRNGPDTYVESLLLQILNIWPEFNEIADDICLIYTGFNSEFSFYTRDIDGLKNQIYNEYNNGKRHFMFECFGEGLSTYIIKKIHIAMNDFVAQYNDIHVYYLSGSIDSKEIYHNICEQNNLTPYINVKACDYFVYVNQRVYPRLEEEYSTEKRLKNFLCFNKVYRQHRIDLLELMLAANLVNDKCYYSFQDYSQPTDEVLEGLLYEHYPNIKSNLEFIKTLQLNFDPSRTNPIDIRNEDLDYYKNSYFSVVTETIYYGNDYKFPRSRCHVSGVNAGVFVTEKTTKVLALKHPFIIVSVPGMLSKLRERGFKTFYPYIDETYDTIIDDDLRMKTIVDEVKRLSNQTDDEWVTWCKNVKEIVEHNYNHFFSQVDFRA